MAENATAKASRVIPKGLGDGTQSWTVSTPKGQLTVNTDEAIVTEAGALLFKTNQATWLAYSPAVWTLPQKR
jgi:hypothetical protein